MCRRKPLVFLTPVLVAVPVAYLGDDWLVRAAGDAARKAIAEGQVWARAQWNALTGMLRMHTGQRRQK